MSTTVGDLINDTKRAVYGTHRGVLNRASVAVTTTDTQITCSFPLNFGEGAYLGLEDEIVYVHEVDTTTNKASTVERSQLGTTAVQHAINTQIEVEPRFPKILIRDALQDDIRSWPDSVYRVDVLTPSVSTSTRAVNLTGINSDVIDILEVRHSPVTGSDTWPEIRGFDFDRHADTTDFSTGFAIYLPYYLESSSTLRVEYARPFDVDTFTDATTLTTVGLGETMYDIPPLGAAYRLLQTREIKRTFTEGQGESRRAQEVPPGFIGAVAERLKVARDRRLEDEARRLARRYPLKGWG